MPAVFKMADGTPIPLKNVNLNDSLSSPLAIKKVFWKDANGVVSEVMGGGELVPPFKYGIVADGSYRSTGDSTVINLNTMQQEHVFTATGNLVRNDTVPRVRGFVSTYSSTYEWSINYLNQIEKKSVVAIPTAFASSPLFGKFFGTGISPNSLSEYTVDDDGSITVARTFPLPSFVNKGNQSYRGIPLVSGNFVFAFTEKTSEEDWYQRDYTFIDLTTGTTRKATTTESNFVKGYYWNFPLADPNRVLSMNFSGSTTVYTYLVIRDVATLTTIKQIVISGKKSDGYRYGDTKTFKAYPDGTFAFDGTLYDSNLNVIRSAIQRLSVPNSPSVYLDGNTYITYTTVQSAGQWLTTFTIKSLDGAIIRTGSLLTGSTTYSLAGVGFV